MKNVIKIRPDWNLSAELEVTEEKANSICILVLGSRPGSCVEIFHGSEFGEVIQLPGDTVMEVPERYCQDGGICRIRYKDNEVVSNFIHIVGDESGYTNLILQKKSGTIFFCAGATSVPKDYMKLLAELIQKGTKSEAKACYRSLLQAEKEFNKQLERLNAQEGRTVRESVESLKGVKNDAGTLGQRIIIEHAAVGLLKSGGQEVMLREVEEWR